MFVYIAGNVKQNIFKLDVAGDPFKRLASIQAGNPYKLSIISKVCVQSKNAATLIERLGRQRLSEYERDGGWLVDLPGDLRGQFGGDHYLRAIAAQAGVKIVDRNTQAACSKGKYLQSLSDVAKVEGLTFEDVLEKVEQAYDEGVCIDKVICK